MNNYLKIKPESDTLYIKYRGAYLPVNYFSEPPTYVAINPDYTVVGFDEYPLFSEAENCWFLFRDNRIEFGNILGVVDSKEIIDYKNSLEEVGLFNFLDLLKDIEYKYTL